jgi:O-acetyl-ADP-ribose deacetylase (regulator of RNase III)
MKQGKYEVIKGDATAPNVEPGHVAIIAHVANDLGAWGKGFVLALSKKWDKPEKEYKKMVQIYKDLRDKGSSEPLLGVTQVVPVEPDKAVANMVAQRGIGGKKPLRYAALVSCMTMLALKIKDRYSDNDHVSIHCPKFGAGLAGGDWTVIEALIKECWCDYGIDVTVYEFE